MSGITDSEELFTSYFNNGHWVSNDDESVSGSGSTKRYMENIREKIPELIENLDVKTILDAPCGDYNWFQLIQRTPEVQYIGGDIVKPLIERNQSLFTNHNTRFIHLDITKDKLPNADLWLLRDCLFHLSNKDINLVLYNFLRSNIPYLLTTTYPESEVNKDINTGSARQLNLELPPFNLCPPILYLDDWIEGYPVRKLGLWSEDAILTSLWKDRVKGDKDGMA